VNSSASSFYAGAVIGPRQLLHGDKDKFMSSIEIVLMVMQLLRPDWVVKRGKYDNYVSCSDPADPEKGIECFFDANVINVQLMWPKRSEDGTYFGHHEKGINVSLLKRPEVIAREIERRLLCGYLSRYSQQRAYADRAAVNRGKQLEVIELMTKLTCGNRDDNRVWNQYFDIQVKSGGNVRVQFYETSVETATALIEAFNVHQKNN
jgi:hypothetical protein